MTVINYYRYPHSWLIGQFPKNSRGAYYHREIEYKIKFRIKEQLYHKIVVAIYPSSLKISLGGSTVWLTRVRFPRVEQILSNRIIEDKNFYSHIFQTSYQDPEVENQNHPTTVDFFFHTESSLPERGQAFLRIFETSC